MSMRVQRVSKTSSMQQENVFGILACVVVNVWKSVRLMNTGRFAH